MKPKKSKQEIRKEIHKDFAEAITRVLPFIPAIFLMSLGMLWGRVVQQDYDRTITADEFWKEKTRNQIGKEKIESEKENHQCIVEAVPKP